MEQENKTPVGRILLVAFYNIKALGVRYLEAAYEKAGYEVKTVFYKDFNSVRPSVTTETELGLLCDTAEQFGPMLIGLSVMSSMYLDTVHLVMQALKDRLDVPIVCGGAFATMFPEHFLERGMEFVIRSDGEISSCQLADALRTGQPYEDIPSLCYMKDGAPQINEIGNVLNDIDGYGIPVINSKNAVFIENNKLVPGDPQLNTLSYEVIASRGCPFTCSYCCCENLRRLLPRGIKPVRTRSVKSIMEELIAAKKECKRITFVHFYDEIFPNTPGWVDEFVVEYKKHIDLPFTIWSHPKMVSPELLAKLKKIGLTEVIMGIQSGSEHIRKDVFHRYETQEDIVNATRAIKGAGVFWASYDFMLQHPFETLDDLKETYWLVKRLRRPYELQLHGLNFLPGTDIVPMAIEQGYLTEEEMDKIMYAPMEDQFGAYWQLETSPESSLWYRMTYCLQFPILRQLAERCENDVVGNAGRIDRLFAIGEKIFRFRYLYKKAFIVLKRIAMAIF